MLFGPGAAHANMFRLISGYWQSQLILVAAKLGIADALAAGPLSSDAIARQVGAHEPNLHRVLHALASLGVFASDAQGRFRLTPLSQTLRSDHPGSLRDFSLMLIDDYNWQAWGALHHAVTTGGSAFEKVHGADAFSYMRQHPQKEQAFSAAMAGISMLENTAVVRAYAFGRLHKLVDVGGAHGHLLAAILRKHRKLHGVLFDQPQVVEAAANMGFITGPDVRDRCEATGGDFFESVPEGADGYVMKYITHDWDDDKCVRILSNCRRAMVANGRVLVADRVLSKRSHRDWGRLVDINMMVVPGGKERTRDEFRELFAQAGLRLKRVLGTMSSLSVLEGVLS
jgi:hypothetical protein